jgi:hypothetical protein
MESIGGPEKLSQLETKLNMMDILDLEGAGKMIFRFDSKYFQLKVSSMDFMQEEHRII